MTRRAERVNELLREEISEIIQREMKDPRLGGLISITAVEVSPDFSHARVFVSVLGSEEESTSSLKALNAGAAFLRHELRGRLKSLRHVPELSFRADTSIARGAHLTALLNQVAHEHDGEATPAPDPAEQR
jgi:ribosome-binding factor A